MGIPGLMKDLATYKERANLGEKEHIEDTVGISSIVIDGPSFVYHVYSQQMKSLSQIVSPMSYCDVNEGVVSVLDELEKHGVNIKKIYFDGALPVTKRTVRLERLEKHRRSLDLFVRSRLMEATVLRDHLEQPAKGEALFQTAVGYPQIHNLKAFEPPFMVASAIEHLKKSRHSSLLEVIPDEAEIGCIMYACREKVAVLSNDSDLVVYPSASAQSITLVLLHSLEQVELQSGIKVLMTDCLRPSEIIRKLQISSLHLLAFQRHLDPSAPSSVIKQRAKKPLKVIDTQQRLYHFVADYTLDNLDRSEKSVYPSVADPRLSELQYQYLGSRHAIDASTELHVYLPSLFEDHSRQAPWSHGSELRELAYSLFNVSMRTELQRNTLLEYQRRGRQIRGVDVVLLDIDKIVEVFPEETSLLQQVQPCNTTEDTRAMWQKLALKELNMRWQVNGRAGSLPSFHAKACLQAVLYSLRLLKQVWELVRADQIVLDDDHARIMDKLVSLPDLADMMDALRDQCPIKRASESEHD